MQKPAVAAAADDPWINDVIKNSVAIYGRLKDRNPKMPKLLLHTDVMMHGTAASTEEFVSVMEKQFDLAGGGSPVTTAPR